MRALLGRICAAAWTGAGLLLPFAFGIYNPELILGGSVLLALLLMVFAMAGSNVELRFTTRDEGPVFSPVGVPIVLAIVLCPPPQAMLVASMGYLLDRATWRRSPRLALETAGLGAMSAFGAGLVVHGLGLSFETHAGTLVTAVVATATFLVLDAATYAIWYQFESGSGGDIIRYFLRQAPVDVAFTTVAVALAGPLENSVALLVLVLVAFQLAIYALYRMVTSEARHRAQSSHLRDVFGRYVPESIVEQLASSSAAVQLGGEERDVSVMFCDIRGFTSWAEAQTPEHVVGELNTLLGGLAALVMESGGTLDKFTGDGLMAFWGAPLEQLDHAERACETAFAMQRLLLERARDARVTPFRIGIGVASGPVVVGNVGHEQRLEYTAIGDTVNLAARLEQSTKELEITTALAHETWERLPSELQGCCPEAATVQVRGRNQPVRVHELVGTLTPDDVTESPVLQTL
ncbi:MAG: adenylate/guanylate cyclase domain-containing protein [Gaiellales bacterium]